MHSKHHGQEELKVDTRGKYLTLDWDNIDRDVAYHRLHSILEDYANVQKLVLSESATKGFHVRVYLYGDTNIAQMRFELGDDPRRLLHDLLNRPDNIHDILWSRKTVSGIPYEEKHLITIHNPRVT